MPDVEELRMKPARLGVVLESGGPDGPSGSMLRLLGSLDRAQYEVHVCALGRDSALAEEYATAGIPLATIVSRGLLDFSGRARLLEWIRRVDPDLLQGCGDLANDMVRVLGQEGRPRVVLTSYDLVPEVLPPRRAIAEHLLWRRARAALATSKAAARALERRFSGPVRVIPPGLEPIRFPPRDQARARLGYGEHEPLVLCEAAFHPHHGHEALIFAFQQVRLGVLGARLLLLGEGSTLERCRQSVSQLHMDGDAVSFLGWRRDRIDFYAACDVVVLASSEEGYPESLLHAAFAARPVVAGEVGGVPEIVIDRETGLLVAPLQSHPLSNGLIELLLDPAARSRMGRRAAALAARSFMLQTQLQRTEELLRELLDPPD